MSSTRKKTEDQGTTGITDKTIVGMGRPKGGYWADHPTEKKKDGTPKKWRIPGVTTITSRFQNSRPLMIWANQQGLDGYTLNEAREEAMTAGSLCHDMVGYKLNGRKGLPRDFWKDVEPPVKSAARMAFQAWWDAWTSSNYEVLAVEVPIVSPRLGYAGTPDAIVLDQKGRTGILDWKTGKGIYIDHLLQMAAYKPLIKDGHGWEVDFARIMRIHKVSGQLLSAEWTKTFLDGEALEQFETFRLAYQRDKDLNKMF